MSASVRRFLARRNTWLLVAFGSFLALILLFALLYHAAYRRDRASFLFAADILRAQSTAFSTESSARLGAIAGLEAATEDAVRLIARDSGLGAGQERSRIPTSLGLVLIVHRKLAGGMPWTTVSVEDSLGATVHSWELGPFRVPNDAEGTTVALQQYERVLTEEAATLRSRLATLASPAPDVWSFWDFLYFSVITQGTVGYGDMVPNTTYVRALVITQVLISYLIVLVLLNWAIVTPKHANVTDGV